MSKRRVVEAGGRTGCMRARKGASFLEYALLAALIGIVGAVGIMKYGQAISDFFSGLADKTTEVTPKKSGGNP